MFFSFSDGGETQNFFADLLVAPRVALQPLPPDPDHVQVRNLANLQLERQLGEPGGIAELATQDVALVIKKVIEVKIKRPVSLFYSIS